MKILTATTRTQGQRASDFTWCIDGELVIPAVVICGQDEREGPDGGCGCGRSFGGLNSHKSTTTALVRDVPGFTTDDVILAVRSFLEQAGWADLLDDVAAVAVAEAAEVLALAESHPVGTVLEHRLGEFAARAA